MNPELERTEPCPDCGGPLAITAVRLKRGRARCPRCALDVRLDARDVGDGPGRTSTYLQVVAPALSPPARLRVERDAHHLVVSLAPDTRIGLAVGGGGLAVAVAVAGLAGWIPTLLAAVLFIPLVAGGFVLASQEHTRFSLVVDRGVVRINGGRVDPELADELLAPLALGPREQRWLREVVAARIAGDGDEAA